MQIRYPKRIPAGTIRDEMVLDIDLAPTFLDLAGLPIPSYMQGKSVLPLARQADPSFRKEWLYEYYEYPNPENVAVHRGIRTDRYKLIHYYKDNPEAFELYDLEKDPNETQNLYGLPSTPRFKATSRSASKPCVPLSPNDPRLDLHKPYNVTRKTLPV